MVSRDTIVQAGTIAVALAAFAVVPSLLDVPIDSASGVVVSVLFNATVLGGAHLYLALRDDGDSVPVASRWRFLALVAWISALALLGSQLLSLTALSYEVVAPPVLSLAVAGIAAYWWFEARSGYHESRTQGRI